MKCLVMCSSFSLNLVVGLKCNVKPVTGLIHFSSMLSGGELGSSCDECLGYAVV